MKRLWLFFILGAMAAHAQAPPEVEPDLYDVSVYRTFEIIFSNPNWHEVLTQNFEADRVNRTQTYVKADLNVDGVTYREVGVQFKGNSSFFLANTLKKPFKITMDAFLPGQELYGHDILTFNNGLFDPTLVREIICYDILRKYMPAPRANAVFVRAGLSNSIRTMGVYASVERIDKKFLKKHFEDGNGNRYKALASSMAWAGDNPSTYKQLFSYNGRDENTAYLDLVGVLDALNNTPSTRLRDRLDAVFSVDRAIRQIAGGIVLLNWDDLSAFGPHGHNYFLYNDQRYNQMVILPWDWDLGLSEIPTYPVDSHFLDTDIPLVQKLMAIPELKARYFSFVKMMSQDLDWSVIGPKVRALRNLIEADILDGDQEFFTRLEYEMDHVALENAIQERATFLAEEALLAPPVPTITEVGHIPFAPQGDQPVMVTARVSNSVAMGAVNLYYQAGSNYQRIAMADDGAHGDGAAGDGVYGAEIPFQRPGSDVNYYVEAFSAEEAGGAPWYEPIFTEHQPFTYQVLKTPEVGDVVINEVLAHSDDGLPDWVELHNTTMGPISVGEWFLSDDADNFKKYQIKANQVIPAGGFLVLYEDRNFGEASTDPGKLESFALSENGETLFLSSGSGDIITGFKFQETFGASATGVALGRHFKPSTQTYNFVAMVAPTPGYANDLPVVGPIVISEIMYAPAGNGDAEYLELRNISDRQVTLFDASLAEPWQMTDGISYTFPSSAPLKMSPGDAVLLVKDETAFAAAFEAPENVRILQWDDGSLSNGGEKVELGRPGDVNGNGVRQFIRVDRVNYDDANGWPPEADGAGRALGRKLNRAYGNDVTNWAAVTPRPGLGKLPVQPSRVIYPWLSNRNGNFKSILIANNVGVTEAEVTLTATRADGASQTITRTLPARGFLERSVSSLFPRLGSGAGYTVVLESESPHVYGVWVTNSLQALSGESPSQGVAVRVSSTFSNFDRRHGQALGFGYLPVANSLLSAPVLVNTGTTATDVQLAFYNRSGLLVGSETLMDLQPGRPFAAVANDLVGVDDPDVMLLARSTGSRLTGVSFVFDAVFFETAIGNATTLPTVRAPDIEKTLVFPWISNREDQFKSTLVLNNAGDVAIDVEFMAQRENGVPVSTSRRIPARGFLAESAQTLFSGLGSGDGFAVVARASGSSIFGQWVSQNLRAASGASPAQGVAIDLPLHDPASSDRVGETLLLGYLPVSGDAFSAPVLVNLGSEPTDVTLYFFDKTGALILKDETSYKGIEPFRPYARLANELLPPETGNLQVVAVSNKTRVSGVVFVFNTAFSEPAIGNAIALEHPFEVIDD